MAELVEVALLGKTVGLKGFVRLYNKGDFPNQFKKDAIFCDKDGKELVVKSYNHANDTISFYGFEDIDSAKTLTNKTIYTTKDETRKNCKLKKGEFFYFDVIGCEIYENNQRLGEVEDIDEVGANHLFLVKTDENLIAKGSEKSFYIPYIDVYIEKVDVKNKKNLHQKRYLDFRKFLMKFTFVTLFESLVRPYFEDSILGRAVKEKLVSIDFLNPRDFSADKHKKVDDYMVGGGAGLLMTCQPLDDTLNFLLKNKPKLHTIFLAPAGKKFTQNDARRLAKKEHICLVCGRYEGIDERIAEKYADEIFCIGDFVMTGGELGALCISDAISRNIDGVLGNNESLEVESFEGGLLEAPSFTKPSDYKGSGVVSAFLKGDHAKIRALKNNMAFLKTRFFRPDLYRKFEPPTKEKI